jgi:uroporphyrinogen-III synthase
MPAILLTRPADVARQFAAQLRTRLGAVDIVISPLLEITWASGLPGDIIGTPIFTSRNGVAGYVKAGGTASGLCWCVGDATANAARAAGFAPRASSGNAQTLIAAILKSGEPGPFVHLRGAYTRGEVAKRLTQSGRSTQEVIVYDQKPRDLTADAHRRLKSEKPVVLPLFSPRTAAQFAKVHRGRAQIFAGVMSEAVAAAVTDLPLAKLSVADRPDASAMLDVTQKLFREALRLEGGRGAK